MDGDTVDITNLQRQVLHTTADIGKPKVESGTRTLKALNPDVNVIALPTRITVDNIMDIIKDYTSSSTARTTSRRATGERRVLPRRQTNVHGSIFQFEGMATCSRPARVPAIAASIRRRRAGSRPLLKRGRRPGVLQEWLERFRRRRPSSWCWASASR